MPQVWIVTAAALITALATGLGALPFYLRKDLSQAQQGLANALAAGLMIGASVLLIQEGNKVALWPTLGGLTLGIVLAYTIHMVVAQKQPTEDLARNSRSLMGTRGLMIVLIMTLHSGAEGISIGVAFGPGEELGFLVTLAMALQNIPEGLAIALVLVPSGVSVGKATLWAIVSSLPQPLLALPAYFAVLAFEPLMPWGLGLAAGAMVWMCLADLLPESFKSCNPSTAGTIATFGLAAMMLLDAVV